MKFELIEEVPRVAGTRFRTKTLATELRWDGVSPLPPTVFDTFRISYRTHVYRGPNGERWSYDELREHHRANDVEFPGTSYFIEATDFEFWYDWGDDGHVEWEYQGTWRFFLHPETEDEESEWRWLEDTSGDMIQAILAEHLYEINRDKWEKNRA
jgi:hypothetical protein